MDLSFALNYVGACLLVLTLGFWYFGAPSFRGNDKLVLPKEGYYPFFGAFVTDALWRTLSVMYLSVFARDQATFSSSSTISVQ